MKRKEKFKDWLWFQKEVLADKPFKFKLWRTRVRLSIACKLWKLIGHPICPKHGFHAQSWITGKCKKCDVENRTLESGTVLQKPRIWNR